MNRKIKNYIDLMFQDVPSNNKTKELKEEILSNANERYEDYIAMGKSENEAYGLAVSSIGDIDELIEPYCPNEIQGQDIRYYRNRNAKVMAVAVMMYIVSPLTLIFLSIVNRMELGLLLMFLLIALATGLIIYSQMSTPQEVKRYNQSMEEKEWSDEMYLVSKRNRSMLNSIRSLMWTLCTVIYFIVTFTTHAWHITWLVWMIGSAVDRMIYLYFQTKEDKEYEN